MNNLPTVYKVRPILDDPRFEGFGTGRIPSLRGKRSFAQDFIPDASTNWEPPRLAPIWKPLKVMGRVRPFNDYPCVSLIIPAMSKKAVDALWEFLEPNGELLPLVSEVGEYYIYNVTTMVAAFDGPNSDVAWMNDWIATSIYRYEFHPEALEGLTIFTIPEDPATPYATEPFVARARQAGLQGFDFRKVWPTGPGEEISKVQKTKIRERQALRQQSVILRLALTAKEPTAAERQAIERLLKELDTLLMRPAAEQKAPAIGNAELREFAPHECAVSLSCPDADVLIRELRPWLKKIKWPTPPRVFKRLGEFTNDSAPEQLITL